MSEILNYLLVIPAIAIVVTIHEYTKALVSSKLGDTIPAEKGRLTLNPLKHLEVIGAIFMLFFAVGWGQPTQTSPVNYKDRKKGTILTYTIPSVVNLLFGIAIALLAAAYYTRIINIELQNNIHLAYIYLFLRHLAFLNVQIALFNIIPIYPLDGAKVLACFLYPKQAMQMSQYEKILQMLLIVLVCLGIVNMVINPIATAILFFL